MCVWGGEGCQGHSCVKMHMQEAVPTVQPLGRTSVCILLCNTNPDAAACSPCHDVLLDQFVCPLHKQLVGELRAGGAAALIQRTGCNHSRQLARGEEGRKQRHTVTR